MLREIKEIKISELQSKKDITEVDRKLQEVEGQIAELDNQINTNVGMIVYRGFNWIQRHITQRKEYKDYIDKNRRYEALTKKRAELLNLVYTLKHEKSQKELMEYEINRQIEEIESTKTLKELGFSFEEAISFLEENGLPIVLGEEDKNITENESEFNGLEDLILVHKTNYRPEKSRINSAKEAEAIATNKIDIDGQEYNYAYARERNTVHSAVNHEVASHMYGDWTDCKYAVLIPFKNVDKSQIGEAAAVDTFTVGGIDLKSGDEQSKEAKDSNWILCPIEEVEEVRKNNKGVHVIGYEGQNVTGYAGAFLSTLGYKNEKGGMWAWANDTDMAKYLQLAKREGLGVAHHTYSKYSDNEKILENANKAVSIFKMINANGLIKDKEDVNHIYEILSEDAQINSALNIAFGGQMLSRETGAIERLDYVSIIMEKLIKNGISMPDEYRTILQNIPFKEAYSGLDKNDIITEDIDKNECNPEVLSMISGSIDEYNGQTTAKKNIGHLKNTVFLNMVLTQIEKQRNREERQFEEEAQEK